MVDILIAVDGQKLADQVGKTISAGTQDSPTVLGSYSESNVYISMVAQNNFATNDQGGSELTVTVNPGEDIRWTMTTFDNNMNHTAYLYDGRFNDASTGAPTNAIDRLGFSLVTTNTYLPSSSDQEGPVTEVHNKVSTYEGTVNTAENIQYYLSFTLIDNSDGSTIGYFCWDPFINVNS